jgi:hypothetical protein
MTGFSFSFGGLTRRSKVFEFSFSPGHCFVDGEREGKNDQDQCPEVLHQKVCGIDLEQGTKTHIGYTNWVLVKSL